VQDDPRVPAGWYTTADGTEKYWDGFVWTRRRRWFRRWLLWLGVAVGCGAAMVLVVHASTSLRMPARTATPEPKPTVALLRVTNQKDGDSFAASDGREYRLGMVNAPELNEPCGREAREFSRRFLTAGFTADTYSSDRYGRQVAEIFDRSGRSLNLALAGSGLADDRYLRPYWHENPAMARKLEEAFAQSKHVDCAKASFS